jgi:hypothetical protein
LVKVAPLLAVVGDWQGLLDSARPEAEVEELRRHCRTGRPLGEETFLDRPEGLVGRGNLLHHPDEPDGVARRIACNNGPATPRRQRNPPRSRQEFCGASGRSKALRRKHLRRSFRAANLESRKNPRRAS